MAHVLQIDSSSRGERAHSRRITGDGQKLAAIANARTQIAQLVSSNSQEAE